VNNILIFLKMKNIYYIDKNTRIRFIPSNDGLEYHILERKTFVKVFNYILFTYWRECTTVTNLMFNLSSDINEFIKHVLEKEKMENKKPTKFKGYPE